MLSLFAHKRPQHKLVVLLVLIFLATCTQIEAEDMQSMNVTTITNLGISSSIAISAFMGTPPRIFAVDHTSRLLEFSFPPSESPSIISSLPINISLVSLAVLRTTPDKHTSHLYVCFSNSLSHFIIHSPDSLSSPSTFSLNATITMPAGRDIVDSLLWVDDYLYVGGKPASSANNVAVITRIPFNNFTTEYMIDHDPILLNDENQLSTSCYDGSYVYYGGNTARAYKVNPSSFSLVSYINLTDVSGSVLQVFADPARASLYLVINSDPNSLVRVNTSTFQQSQKPLELDYYSKSTKVALHDVYGGHTYFGQFTTPGEISHVNLQSFTPDPSLFFSAPLGEIYGGYLDADNSLAYFLSTINSSYVLVKVELPLPCAGLATVGNADYNCSYPHGFCEYATCHCFNNSGYEGLTCSSRRCLNDCHRDGSLNPDGISHGTCYDGNCTCTSEYTGSDCSIRQCTRACSGHGSCTPDFQCHCDLDWTGEDCATFITVPSCDRLHTCGECARNISCGWCEDSNECQVGDSFGPLNNLCHRYSYSTCPSLFFFSFGYALTSICWVFMVASALITLVQDYTLPDNTKARRFVLQFWWRNQLAAKTWQLVEYIQLIGITAFLSVEQPASYLEFVLPFQWSVLHLPYPFSNSDVIRPPTPSNDNSFFVQGRVVDSAAHEVLLGNLFIFALIIGVLILLFVIPVAIFSALADDPDKKFRLGSMWKSRAIYSLIRLLQFAYLPLMVSSIFTLIWFGSANSNTHSDTFKTSLALSIIVVIILGLGLPIAAFLKIYNKDKELFAVAFSMKYGSLYQKFHFRKGFFTSIHIIKLLAIALCIGLMYQNPIPQLIILSIIHAIYFVIILISKPYTDHIYYFTELVTVVLKIIMFLLFFGFRDHSAAAGWAVGLVVIHTLTICVIVAGIISTLFKMNNITNLGELKNMFTSNRKDVLSEDMTGLQKEHRISSSSNLM